MTKLERLREKMKESSLDAVIVFDELNQRYLSEFAFTDGFLFITLEKAYLITDFRYYEMALKGANAEFTTLTPSDRAAFIDETMADCSGRTVGFEGGFVSYLQYTSLKEKHPQLQFENIGNMIEVLRAVKTPEELEYIGKAQEITDKAFTHLLSMITPNMTELDVAVELEFAMRRLGSDGVAFETIAVSGDASALPHGTPRNVKLKQGFLTMDYGAKYNGYCSDMTRTIVIGKADAEIKKLYNTVLKAQSAALDYLRCGCDCAEADRIARDIIDSDPDFNGKFGHSLGHSVGLFIHESPSLNSRMKGRTLECGNVVTVEPGIYLFGKYGCRIEDMVAIEKNGVHNFTKSTKELIEIL